jgi:glutamate 5-kinase
LDDPYNDVIEGMPGMHMKNSTQKKRIIVKVGTSTLTAGGEKLNLARMVDLVQQIASLRSAGHQMVVVSSGGIAAGREAMAYPELAHFLPAKQMMAAVGQPRLMAIYTQLFNLYQQQIAQVLLTRDDLADRRRYLNARNTLEALLSYGIIPIINENDTTATEEIRFGDNDNLSALVANLLEANLLLLLTDQDGLFTADPRLHPQAALIRKVDGDEIPPEIMAAARDSGIGLGTGGMASKLQAADLARRSGTAVIIANGSLDQIITRVIAGESLGTTFSPLGSHLESRKRFLLAGIKDTSGILVIDDGAVRALHKGGSLLPVGIVGTVGDFSRGQSVTITDQTDHKVAVGLVNYDVDDVQRISGKQSEEIDNILGYAYGSEVVHHDNLVLL